MKIKYSLLTLCFILFSASMNAQDDYTSAITNPSFENEWTGWTHKNMALQGNDVFTLKVGSTYVEKWTGRGGAVGDALLYQVISKLPPGQYKLRVAAQNIQEDTPKAIQTGAWIFAGDNTTQVNVCDTYEVPFSYVHGDLKIGFQAVGATGNYLCVDYFRFIKVSDDLSSELAAAITAAEEVYGNGTGPKANLLKNAIDAAKAVAANSSATGQNQADAIIALENASDEYKLANASPENPYDLTDKIVNPSFETGDLTGWTSSSMGLQSNNVFDIKQGTYYAEKWTGTGNAVGDARLTQTVKDMMPGRYILRAAAQNIQENTPNRAQTGAWIVANTHKGTVTTRKDYALEFMLVSDWLNLGFLAEGATGNWISVDNFRLEYISDNFDDIKTEYNAIIAQAEELATKQMNGSALEDLQTAINNAKPLANQTTTDGWGVAARQLENTIAVADESQKAFAKLLTAIDAAQAELDASSASQKENYQNAIDAARAVYNKTSTTNAQALAAIETLSKAAFAFRVENGSGTAPKVTTDPRFIKGSTWAFGRSTVSGSNIIEQGFCWSTDPDPKVTDNHTSEYINQSGRIYWLRDLKPGTMYYMRAYAITNSYAVGYGDVIKFATVPKSSIGHWYNNGGDEATNDRINYAINTAMDYYWANASSIHGFGISVSYSPGTQTADCSYGGSMRVGASSSYQQPGTIMHEALHGIGVGTHGIWWDVDMHSGNWLGDRANAAVQFWNNDNNAMLAGDSMHLWPYGCNGAHEDSHDDNLYCMMGILAQALNEDGLPGSGAIGYALPYYSFTHDDGVKYYIKNEDEDHGLYSSYLVETSSHTLEWKAMSAEEAANDNSAAWYLTFTPSNQFYQLRNAKTGYYMTYSSGFKTIKHTSPTSADNFHLMRGRVDVKVEKNTFRGYYIIHNESSATPPTLAASGSGKTVSQGFDIHRSATAQRWLILTAEQAQAFDAGSIKLQKDELNDLIAQIRKLQAVPHTEDVQDVDATLDNNINAIEATGNASTSVAELSSLIEQARQEAMTFLNGVSVKDPSEPFDLTFMLQNPNFDKDATTGWTFNSAPGYNYQTAEYFENTFNFYQTLQKMPAGTYKLCANAFQRPGAYNAVLAPYNAGTAKITTTLYIAGTNAQVCHICDDRQTRSISSGCQQLSDKTYIPDNMQSAAAFFAKGLYESSVEHKVTKSGNAMRVGIKCTSAGSAYWSIFDNFRLYFYGNYEEATAIDDLMADEDAILDDSKAFDLSGRQVDIDNLRPGIYIIGGKKVMVK